MAMEVRLNGEIRTLVRAKTILGLLEEIGCHPQTVIVEHNGIALRRSEWPEALLQPNDQIEVVRVVAGG